MNWRLQLTRLTTRWYPFLPGIARIPRLYGTSGALPDGDDAVVNAGGVKVRVRADPMFGSLWRQRVYEPFPTKVFRRVVRPGDTVLDVGTNFGWFAALFARWTGAGGRVHAFEPVPFIADMARETLRLSGVEQRVTLNEVGLGSADGSFEIFTFDGLPLGHASATDLGRADAHAHTCRVLTLDGYVRQHRLERIGFMKLDVEGHELEVLRGGREMLARPDGPVVYFETNQNCLDHRGLRAQQLVDLLRDAGYTTFVTFSVRAGFVVRDRFPDNRSGDHLAFKPAHTEQLRQVRSTGRFLR